MIDKSESIYSADVWCILAADQLTLRGLWVFSENNILQTDFEGEKLARKYLGKIVSSTEKNITTHGV